jgi:cathepsin D
LVSSSVLLLSKLKQVSEFLLVAAEQATSPGSGPVASDAIGLIGFAWPALSVTRAKPYWQAVFDAGVTSSPQFSLFLARHGDPTTEADGNKKPGGVLTIGGVNSSLFTGEIEFLNMTSPNQMEFWTLDISSTFFSLLQT